MQLSKKQFIDLGKILGLALVLSIGIGYISAAPWTAPAGPPPDNNTDAPLNVSSSGQIKLGGLSLNAGLPAAPNGLIVAAGNVGIGIISPTTRLDVNGTAKVTGFQLTTGAGASRVLTSNASGVGTWVTPAAAGGVTQIIAGSGITVSPAGGTGAVTVTRNAISGGSSLGTYIILDPEDGDNPSTAGSSAGHHDRLCPPGMVVTGVQFRDKGGSGDNYISKIYCNSIQ